jgi:tetratricopeptide (TPR) repeat protein
MQDLAEIALLAFRNAKYREAIELLLQVTDREPNNWMARLYLGLSYQRLGRIADAHRLFMRLRYECTDQLILQKVKAELPLIEAEMTQKFSSGDTKKDNPASNDPGNAANWQ